MCQACGLKPQAWPRRMFCYDCKPSTRGRPRPCRKCGATGDYWSGGLCRGCHPYTPRPAQACRDCLAWGATRTRAGLCFACKAWRRDHPGTGECISCHRTVSLDEHRACRLCWTQTFLNQARYGLPRDVMTANSAGQQLWFANMASPRRGYQPHPRRDYRQRKDQIREPKNEEPIQGSGPVVRDIRDQLDLFAYHPIEDPARRHGFGEPPNGHFAAVLDRLTLEHAQRHGWTERQTTRTRITLRVLQARSQIRRPPIKATDVEDLTAHNLYIRLALIVLADNDLLHEDRSTPQAWFTRRITGLPEPMASELRTWFDVLHNGSTTPPRSHPRHYVTIKTRTNWAMPTLRNWAKAGHRSLREITPEDIHAVIPSQGTPRATLGVALRSIFGTLKRHRVLFTNPTAHLHIGSFERGIPMPLNTTLIQQALHSPDPATAAITTLIGIHGLRPCEATRLELIQVRDHRIFLPDRTVLLAPETKAKLDAYLAHRHSNWPNSINPHFLIHTRSAFTTETVQVPWLTDKLGFTASALRQDRMLAEVHAGADLRLITDLFGVTIETAQHYASTTNHPELDNSPTSWRTHDHT